MSIAGLTKKQQDIWNLWDKGAGTLSIRAVAKELGCAANTVQGHIDRMKKKLNQEGADPDRFAPGSTTQTDADGEIKQQWVRTPKEHDEIQRVAEDVLDGLSAEIPRFPKTKKPKISKSAKDYQNLFVFGDAHLNMRAWAAECSGKDWDLKIAIQRHREAIVKMIENALPAATARLISLGDLLHNDGLRPQTFSGTDVDVDGRMSLSLDETLMLLRLMTDLLLEKYSYLDVVLARGNHAPTMELVISKMMAIAYENEPRVNIVDNTGKHIPLVWEKNFQLVTHGDKLTHQKKADIATSIYKHLHGAANFTHILSGHLHHRDQKSISGCLSEVYEVLPTSDAWHTEGGWVTSDQSATVLRYHKNGGVINRFDYNPRFYI
jgi:metallophosphoesterase superfamily enzyme